jgi:uncharacterized protein DUF4079
MEYLQLAHGAFNFLVMLLFFRQGWLGLRIRRGRLAGTPMLPAVRQHRRAGPVVAALGIVGFFIGMTLALVDHGHIFYYPYHFLSGATLALCIAATFLVSRRLKGPAPPWRTVHTLLGCVILVLYPLQVLLGLGILL